MQKKRKSLNELSLSFFRCSLTALFFLSAPVFAQSISLNSEIGKIQNIQNGTNGKTLVFIEEAHADYDVQKSIIQMLRAIISQEGLRLILVEGGWDDMSLADLRIYGTREDREKIVEQYLKDGKISAEEYLDVLGDYDLMLRGIENADLYAANMNAFLKFHDLQEGALKQFEAVESGLSKIQDRIYSKKLKEMEGHRRDASTGGLSLVAYLPDLAKQAGVNLQDYPLSYQLSLFSGTSGAWDQDKVEKEKNELIKALSRKVSKIELEPVQSLLGSSKPEAEMATLREAFEILARYPDLERRHKLSNLRAYRAALEKMQAMDFQSLNNEMRSLEDLAWKSLNLSTDEQSLLEITRFTEYLHKLFKLELGPQDWEILKQMLGRMDPSKIQVELERLSQKSPEAAAAGNALQELWKNVPDARAFYDAAMAREKALIDNTLREMETHDDAAAVVITGGFHTDRMLSEIRKQGFTVMKATPRFEPKDPDQSQKKYFQLLKDRWLGSQAINSKPQAPNPKQAPNTPTAFGGGPSEGGKLPKGAK